MIKKINILLFLCWAIIFTSCPCNVPEWIESDGQEIQNFPEWTTSCNAFSSWLDWQSEEGKRLHKFVSDSIIPDDFNGKFRIGLQGQNITIGFNDKKGTFVRFYNWYGDVNSLEDSVVSVPQDDINSKFIYDCYFKREKSDSDDLENKSKVEMSKIDNKSFHYKQSIGQEVFVDCKFYNLNYFCNDTNNRYTTATDVPIKFSDYFPVEFSVKGENFLYFYPIDTPDSYKKIASFPNELFKYIYCPEGFSFRELNEAKNVISFNLLDSNQSEYIDYFEIQVNSKSDVKLNFYKIIDDKNVLINSLSKSELKTIWLINSKTGETKIF